MTTFYEDTERDTEQTEAQVQTEQFPGLNGDWSFFQVTDAQGKGLTGQYFAIGQYTDPIAQDDGYAFEAVYPILRQPNSALKETLLTEAQINKAIAVTTKDPAATVNRTHPRLIRFLLVM